MSLCGRTRRKAQPLDWSGWAKTAEKSSPLAFQWSMAWLKLRRSTRPIMSSNLRKPSSAMTRRTSSATKVRKRTTYSALPWNRFRRSGSCVAMPTGQVPRWHFRMRMQPSADQGRRAEAEPLGAQQGADHHVAAGPHLAVALHEDAVAEAVEHERLLGLGQADFPGRAGVLDRRQRAGPGAAVVAADEHFVGIALGHARRHRADADFGDQLHRDHAAGIGALQVVDQLGQVFDGVDVVVRRRRDQRHAGRGMPQPRDLVGHLVAGQLAAFARLGALGHLDLQDPGVGQVFDRHAEAAAGDLLDAAIERIAVGQRLVAGRVLAAFARVGVAAQPVHGDGQRLVGLAADRAVRHGAGVEALDDLAGRLDLLQGTGSPGTNSNMPRSVQSSLACSLTALANSSKSRGSFFSTACCKRGDGRGVPKVPLAVEAVLVLAAVIQVQQSRLAPAEARAVPGQRLAGDDLQVRRPPIREAVPWKYLLTNSRFRPTASNCWADW